MVTPLASEMILAIASLALRAPFQRVFEAISQILAHAANALPLEESMGGRVFAAVSRVEPTLLGRTAVPWIECLAAEAVCKDNGCANASKVAERCGHHSYRGEIRVQQIELRWDFLGDPPAMLSPNPSGERTRIDFETEPFTWGVYYQLGGLGRVSKGFRKATGLRHPSCCLRNSPRI